MKADKENPGNHTEESDEYCRAVVAGRIPACNWTVLACRRQLEDLGRKGWVYRFDVQAAAKVCDFIELLPHVRGLWPSSRIVLHPWQKFILTTVFGWVHKETGKRRFRIAYNEVPRKNAKSTLTSGVALYMLLADGEMGAEIYSAATNREQAKIVFQVAKDMVARVPELRSYFGLGVHAHNLHVTRTASKFEALHAESGSLDGLNIHFAAVDELHAHKTRAVYDVLETAMGSRMQPLLWNITTAGSNMSGICYEQRAYLLKILEGLIEDDSYFGVVYSIDEKDLENNGWADSGAWSKANPNLGVSVFKDDLIRHCRQAVETPAAQANFLTKRLNVWVNADSPWMNMLKWDQCGDADLDVLRDLRGAECYVGLDLASKKNLASMVFLFPDNGALTVFCRNYFPREQVRQDAVKYHHLFTWAREGWLTLTEGPVIDYSYIREDLLDLAKVFRVREVAYDPFQATQFSTEMSALGLTMVELGATVKNLSQPMKEVEGLVLTGKLKHNGDPLLSWMISNVVGHYDKKENIFPNKEREENFIDAPVALFMAMRRVLDCEVECVSIYETEGIEFI